jgi:hypothetical protein
MILSMLHHCFAFQYFVLYVTLVLIFFLCFKNCSVCFNDYFVCFNDSFIYFQHNFICFSDISYNNDYFLCFNISFYIYY